MLRHLTVAALRNLLANRLQSAIDIIGLSIGIAAALLMGLVVRNQLTYDHFISGHDRTYLLVSRDMPPGRAQFYGETTEHNTAALIKLNVPEIETVTRLMQPVQNALGEKTIELKRGDISAQETIYWADPNAFEVLPQPVYYGDLMTALKRPDGLVVPRAIARKYFGRDDVVGQTLQVGGHPMTVQAVIEDLPANGTSLKSGIFASGLSSFSRLATYKLQPTFIQPNTFTFVRLKPGVDFSAFEARMPALVKQLRARIPGFEPPGAPPTYAIEPVRIDRLPLFDGLHPGAQTRLSVAALVGILILFIASVNFINLMTARAARRGLEVGVRKVCGANRPLLIAQFLGEAALTVLFATGVAVMLAEWLLPTANAFLTTGVTLDWGNPVMLATVLLGILGLAALAGAYPAFVLSSFHPAGVLKGLLRYSRGASLIRNVLVILQFAILISLVMGASIIYQQHVFVTREGLRANIDQMLVVQFPPSKACSDGFRDEVTRLAGVQAMSCADSSFLGNGFMMSRITFKDQMLLLNFNGVDADIFALYGIKPLAGAIPARTAPSAANLATNVILNETAIRKMGFAQAKDAIGVAIPIPGRPPGSGVVPVVAVVPDFAFQSVEKIIEPTAYLPAVRMIPPQASIKLKGEQIPETLAAIDRIWTRTGHTTTIIRYFLDDHLQQASLSLLRQAQLLAIFSGIAVFLACLGLLGLSISTAERRTKEIGIRKAMGASSADVTRLLLWQFAKPVLWANLIAWPVGYYVMSNWLSGFPHHVALNPLIFVGATLLAVAVALLTVIFQSALVARAVPATALRYE